MLGFLGITSDVTGFQYDTGIVVVAFAFATVFQLLKNNAEEQKKLNISKETESKH